MPCLFALFAGAFPRLGALFIWLARPALFSAAFGGSWFWPLLGVIFMPFTTLMYVIIWTPAGLDFWGWFWIILAAIIDLGGIGGSGFANRNRMPGYTAPMT